MVVELVPTRVILALALPNEGVIVSGVCSASVHDHALQLELVIVPWMLQWLSLALFWSFFASLCGFLLSFGRILPSGKAFLCIG
jgi:hypothetical protein